MGRLAIKLVEVILIVVFGGLCAGMFAYCDDRADSARADPSLDPDEIAARMNVPQAQAKLAELDQRLTALRAQAITSDIDAQRRRAEMVGLQRRFPALRSRGPGPLDAGATPELIAAAKAFDDAAAAAELSTALSSELGAEVTKLDNDRRQKSSALRQAQRDAAAELARQKREHDVDWGWWRGFAWRTSPIAGALALAAGGIAAAFAPGRRRVAGVAVLVSVTLIAIAILLYYLLPIAAALVGSVAGVFVLVLAVRSAR